MSIPTAGCRHWRLLAMAYSVGGRAAEDGRFESSIYLERNVQDHDAERSGSM